MGRPEVVGSGRRKGGDRLGAHLRGTAAEASVAGQEVGGDGDLGEGGRSHRAMIATGPLKERDRWPPPDRNALGPSAAPPSPQPQRWRPTPTPPRSTPTPTPSHQRQTGGEGQR